MSVLPESIILPIRGSIILNVHLSISERTPLVWQDLHDIADASDCGYFRSIIRACLLNDMPKEVKLRYMPEAWR
jgi:hypothetical protein